MIIQKTEYVFMRELLMEAFKVPNDQALAKELFHQVRDTKITLETVLKRLNKNPGGSSSSFSI